MSFQTLGFYSLVVGSGAAMLLSSAVAYYHQVTTLRVRIVSHPTTLQAVLTLAGIGVITVLGVTVLAPSIIALVTVPLVAAALCLLVYRRAGVIHRSDLARYFGQDSGISRLLAYCLVTEDQIRGAS